MQLTIYLFISIESKFIMCNNLNKNNNNNNYNFEKEN